MKEDKGIWHLFDIFHQPKIRYDDVGKRKAWDIHPRPGVVKHRRGSTGTLICTSGER